MSGLFDQIYGSTVKKVYLGTFFSEEITYRVASTGAESTIRANIQEQVGALDPRQDQLFTISSEAADGIENPIPGDQITDPNGGVWTVVKVRTLPGRMHELRCFLPELVA